MITGEGIEASAVKRSAEGLRVSKAHRVRWIYRTRSRAGFRKKIRIGRGKRGVRGRFVYGGIAGKALVFSNGRQEMSPLPAKRLMSATRVCVGETFLIKRLLKSGRLHGVGEVFNGQRPLNVRAG